MMALAQQFADQDYDILLYDEHSEQNRRADFVVDKIRSPVLRAWCCSCSSSATPRRWSIPT